MAILFGISCWVYTEETLPASTIDACSFLQYYTFMSLARIAANSKQLYWGRRYDNNEERAYKVEDENQQKW